MEQHFDFSVHVSNNIVLFLEELWLDLEHMFCLK